MQVFHRNPFDGKSPHSFSDFFSEGVGNRLPLHKTLCSLFEDTDLQVAHITCYAYEIDHSCYYHSIIIMLF